MTEKSNTETSNGQDIKNKIVNGVMTIEQLTVSELYSLLDYETDMLAEGSGDMEIIRKCSKLLDEAEEESLLTEEKVSEIIRRTQAEYVTVVPDKRRTVNRIRIKRAIIIAAAVMLVMTTGVMVASAFGFDIFDYLFKTHGEPEGTAIEMDDITFYSAGRSVEYESIEAMIQAENLDIMYPTKLPEGIILESARKSKSINNTDTVEIYTNDLKVGINIELDAELKYTSFSEIYEHDELKYYIINEDYMSYAYCYYNGNEYRITANNRENLFIIINSMKG